MTIVIGQAINKCQDEIYSNYCNLKPYYQRVCFIPCCIVDVTLDTLISPLSVIEEVAKIPLNLVSQLISSSGKTSVLQDMRLNTSNAVFHTLLTPVKLLTAPIKIMSQFVHLQSLNENDRSSIHHRHNCKKNLSHSQSHTMFLQDNIFDSFNLFSQKHPVLGRFLSVPVSLLDVTLELLKFAINIIENIAKTMKKLLGSNKPMNGVKFGLLNLEKALSSFCAIPAKVLMAPIKFAFQTFAILIDPTKVQSIHKHRDTFL
jgi:hypothetical protein